MKENWELLQRIKDISEQPFLLLNASVGKYYEYHLDLERLQLQDISELTFINLEGTGLSYVPESRILKGIPLLSGDIPLFLEFRLIQQREEDASGQKKILLIINPDPKTLWKDLPADKDTRFYKENHSSASGVFLDKRIVVSSKRGRSHANIAATREDHFSYHNYRESGWSIVAISDGAGSASYSREGSRIASEHIISHFYTKLQEPGFQEFDALLDAHGINAGDAASLQLEQFAAQLLGDAAMDTYKKLKISAEEYKISLNDLHATLSFSLLKKYGFGYLVLSFGVGDCPIALINTAKDKVYNLNTLDVGEFGGGTRFITMPEIFDPLKLPGRVSVQIIKDFSYLILMTDGIYDPKFITESKLANIESWKLFLEDLGGKNEDQAAIDFHYDNEEIAEQLSTWMDFWDRGNHDDRTLAIIY